MSTSGTVTLTTQFGEILSDALYLIGALEEGEAVTGEPFAAGKRAANMMFKSWQQQGVHLWTKAEGILFLNPDQKSYVLPTTQCALDSFGYTTLDGDHIATDTTLAVVDTSPENQTALANADNVGIELADGTRYWTTVNGAPTATGITLTAGLSGAASDGATIFWYTTGITRPSRLLRGAHRPVRRERDSARTGTPRHLHRTAEQGRVVTTDDGSLRAAENDGVAVRLADRERLQPDSAVHV
jgi:hypothetical protein